jgi:hypothetical protein
MLRRALLLIVLSGCASSSSAGRVDQGTSRQATVYTGGADAATIFADRPRPTSVTISQPVDAVWLAVRKVYAELDVPVTVDNAVARQMGNGDFYKSRQFGGRPMTEFVNCGSGVTGPNAATYRIYMSLLTTLVADGKGGTTIATTLSASGRDLTGGSSDKIVCGTSGRLESMFLDRVKAKLGP